MVDICSWIFGGDVLSWANPERDRQVRRLVQGTAVVQFLSPIEWEDAFPLVAVDIRRHGFPAR